MSNLLNPNRPIGTAEEAINNPLTPRKGSPFSKTTTPIPDLPSPPEDEAISSDPTHQEVIEAEPNEPEEDEFLASGWDGSSTSSSLASTSITSSIYNHSYENGRRYHSYKYGRYPIPNDDLEQNREDMKHAMMMELTDGKLFLAPIGDNPQRIIDVGTGTGIWAIEIGDLFPSAEVLGLDLSPIQPQWVPPNVRFLVDDVEDEWGNGKGWDFAHFRGMALTLRNIQRVCDQTFENLKPGGWIEFQESVGMPHCDDGSLPPPEKDILRQFYLLCQEALAKFGMDLNRGASVGQYLTKAGFVNITCVKRKVPVGVWPRDKTMRLIGLYMREAAVQSMDTLAKAFASMGMSAEEREVWGAKVREALMDNTVHRYFYFYFWYAQKPE
ncbi:Trans-aconitate 2-methyltransferase [Podospora fimiseda]|uniref:Trans-aconitate 2-methyltransferase n=1 Tax=Podospora fimiseda TaxID=252190 RepID=A0AAN7H1E9_9PEZI|nr:Trans-aconitate 2-methyltransferase [Podospora fimiseda]